ncbi:MAG: hypothetical protein ACRD5M_13090 [Candidatus Acidiferrales bacterium]
MPTLSETVRKATTFLLAMFLWIHALFFLNFQSPLITRSAHLFRLTVSEILLFGLLVIFSFVTGSGFWKALLSLAYIYAFPFVLLWYALYACFLILRGIHRWITTQANPELIDAPVSEQSASPVVSQRPASSAIHVGARKGIAELLRFLLRPFQRFTFLWCILILVTTHVSVLWLSLIVVLLQLGRKIFGILKVMFFSDPWLRKIGNAFLTGLDTTLAGLSAVTRETAPTNELKNLQNQISLWAKILDFLKDSYLVSRWAWVLGILFLGSVYTYIALLFSFAYYGIGRVSGVSFSWPDALVTSLFIPFFVSELPKVLALKLLGAIHCSLILAVGFGTVVNFLRRRLDSIHAAATEFSDRFADQSIREKIIILEEKSAAAPAKTSPSPEGKK